MTNRVLGAQWMIDRRPKGEGMIKRQRCEGVSYITSQALSLSSIFLHFVTMKKFQGMRKKE